MSRPSLIRWAISGLLVATNFAGLAGMAATRWFGGDGHLVAAGALIANLLLLTLLCAAWVLNALENPVSAVTSIMADAEALISEFTALKSQTTDKARALLEAAQAKEAEAARLKAALPTQTTGGTP